MSTLLRGMKRVASRFQEENLDRVAKTHLELLTEQDRLAGEEKALEEGESRLSDDGGTSATVAKVKKEFDALAEAMENLAVRQRELWELTPRRKTT